MKSSARCGSLEGRHEGLVEGLSWFPLQRNPHLNLLSHKKTFFEEVRLKQDEGYAQQQVRKSVTRRKADKYQRNHWPPPRGCWPPYKQGHAVSSTTEVMTQRGAHILFVISQEKNKRDKATEEVAYPGGGEVDSQH